MTLTTEDGKPCEGIDRGHLSPIAVIGLGALMPDAANIEAFWQNVLDAKVSIRTLPDGRLAGAAQPFWKEGGPGNHTEGIRTPRLERWSTMQNLVGDAGDNRLELCLNRPVSIVGGLGFGRCH